MASSEVRDAIHGLIVLTPQEWQVVDSRAFQRLRGVQQLAMTHLVYPGARHSRFEHCMGACHVAGQLADSIGLQDKARVRLAALCHDLGHGPFSHVSEMVYEDLTGREHVHEQISAAIVRHHPPIRAALGDDTTEWVADLLGGTGHGRQRSVERDIVAGPADIDKLDYLLRDSHYCGVAYGKFDLHKVVESARRADSTGGSALAFARDGIYAVEGMLLARYHMHRQVYGHRTRIATDKMLIRAMHTGVTEGLLPRELFAPAETLDAAWVEEYLGWDDARVVSTLVGAKEGSVAGKVMRSLVLRRLLKRVVRFSFEELSGELGRVEAGYAVEAEKSVLAEELPAAEAEVAAAAGVEPEWVALHWEDLQNPISSRQSFRVASTQVFIQEDDGRLTPINEASEVYGAKEVAARRAIAVYVRPPDGVDRFEDATVAKIGQSAIAVIGRIGASSAMV